MTSVITSVPVQQSLHVFAKDKQQEQKFLIRYLLDDLDPFYVQVSEELLIDHVNWMIESGYEMDFDITRKKLREMIQNGLDKKALLTFFGDNALLDNAGNYYSRSYFSPNSTHGNTLPSKYKIYHKPIRMMGMVMEDPSWYPHDFHEIAQGVPVYPTHKTLSHKLSRGVAPPGGLLSRKQKIFASLPKKTAKKLHSSKLVDRLKFINYMREHIPYANPISRLVFDSTIGSRFSNHAADVYDILYFTESEAKDYLSIAPVAPESYIDAEGVYHCMHNHVTHFEKPLPFYVLDYLRKYRDYLDQVPDNIIVTGYLTSA